LQVKSTIRKKSGLDGAAERIVYFLSVKIYCFWPDKSPVFSETSQATQKK
jgi:hypothetical protein